MYDITCKESFNELKYWVNEVKNNGKKNVLLTIAANKSDILDETVSMDTGRKYAISNGATFFLVSAKDNINIIEMFTDLGLRQFPKLGKDFGKANYEHYLNSNDKDKNDSEKKYTLYNSYGKSLCCSNG